MTHCKLQYYFRPVLRWHFQSPFRMQWREHSFLPCHPSAGVWPGGCASCAGCALCRHGAVLGGAAGKPEMATAWRALQLVSDPGCKNCWSAAVITMNSRILLSYE